MPRSRVFRAHAAESGMDLKAYAQGVGKKYNTLLDRTKAFRVLSNTHVRVDQARDAWRNLAEIHAYAQGATQVTSTHPRDTDIGMKARLAPAARLIAQSYWHGLAW